MSVAPDGVTSHKAFCQIHKSFADFIKKNVNLKNRTTSEEEKRKIDNTLELASRYVFETKIAFDRQLNKVSRFWFNNIA